ncbi:hypothetical protein EB001_08920 [bacterium]|nr:hypothetical protein [bacterium]
MAEPGVLTAAQLAAQAKNAGLANPEITEQIQMLLALKGIDSKLEEAWQLYLQGNYDGMQAAILQSNFYRNNNFTARARIQAKTSQPGVYADGLDKYQLATRKSLVASGLKMDAKLFEGLAVKAYDSGMSEDQLKQLIVSSNLVTGYGGAVLGDTASLKNYANSFGVGKYLDDKYWAQKSQDLFLGTTTTEDIEDEVRNLAASAFPGYSDQIKAGISVDSLASAYKGAMASVLEKDADSITYDDPRLRAALQYVDKDGKPAVKPLWQFERELRMTPEWELTNNARTTVDNLAYKVLSDMGLV